MSAVTLERHQARQMYRSASWLGGSTLLNAAVGVAFWVAAARLLAPADVGVEGAALNVIMLLAWISQLSMHTVLPRFLPLAGSGTRRLLAGTYAVATAAALLCGAGWALWWAVRGHGALGLGAPVMAVAAASVLVWSMFSLQDSVLVGLRRPDLVAVQNAAYSCLKLLLLIPLAVLLPHGGLLVAWMLPALLFIPVINLVVFRRLVPDVPAGVPAYHRCDVLRFVLHELPAGTASMLAVRLVPVIVLARLGATSGGYFLVAWQVLSVLEVALSSLGLALTVQGVTGDADDLRALVRRLLQRVLPLVVAGCAVLATFSGQVLSVFGAAYAQQARTVLVILVCALPLRVVVDCATAVMRLRSNLKTLLAVEALRAPLALLGCWLLAARFGVTGAAASYGIANALLAAAAAGYLGHALSHRAEKRVHD